ncbi:hypothetical protein [Tautonia plasticadhaerens]|uniref:GIY-YIG domain-containing protein n=1 Tax=Tautonia plasticadhaerens TaxID=2527974 RepID=A0A518H5V7_9BACT|nr:hypothetical protein [Tautonia plasticadhaerens]QDV36210.1 hypothetical protein ElP_41280 [Tautonia plasticadhaerens]
MSIADRRLDAELDRLLARAGEAFIRTPLAPPYRGPLPLTRASQAPAARGVYRIYRAGILVYQGETADIRRRLLQHLLCLTHLRITPAPYTFRYGLMPRSTPRTRRIIERRAIENNRRLLPQQREWELTSAFY